MPTLVFWIDVDNTLLANDEVKKVLQHHLQVEMGEQLNTRFWKIYEEVREETGLVDIPLSLKRLRAEIPEDQLDERTYLHVHSIFDNFPFIKALYPQAIETLHHLNTIGQTVIVSDGDLDFQAEKIVNSTLAETVEGRVLLYIHKQEHIPDIQRTYPADHYVMIDDKPQILIDMKEALGPKITTVFVRQGKYAKEHPKNFAPDISVDKIGDLRTFTAEQFLYPNQ
ncbi:HAD family hydrolase [Tengunoibacter tsumagoiensis]|uniref:Haloacid dehalogenase n=1 Tax=Tengunoibacter tsumagoiensis TaxID=2014871 RepID=A0A402A227_9CHLR|nr:HAD family hydrolase [Tengunoibacter tsumagoiensis]GCE13051.1 hypothetical protein KTT_29100 [Tengunoibacter tsumagoiensis]